MNQLFFVARQRPDILRHSGHVFLGAVLASAFTVLLFLELFGCFMGMNVQTIKCLLHRVACISSFITFMLVERDQY